METGNETTLDLRLPSALKEVLEQAAAHLGQSVDDFAVGVLARTAREIIERFAGRAFRCPVKPDEVDRLLG